MANNEDEEAAVRAKLPDGELYHDLKASRANAARGIRLSKPSSSSAAVGSPRVHNPDGVTQSSSCGQATPKFYSLRYKGLWFFSIKIDLRAGNI
jgi:hypothetical protein